MFLILVAVGAGLCSAQTAGKKYYLVGGLFFEGMPPGVGSDNVAAFIIHETRGYGTPLAQGHCAV